MDILSDSLGVLMNQWFLTICLLGAFFFGTAITATLLKKATEADLTGNEYFSLALSGWLTPILMGALLVHASLWIFDSFVPGMVMICLVIVLLFFKSQHNIKIPAPVPVLLAVIFLISLGVNLAFLSRITFPAYFDSAEHYRLIKFLLESPSLSAGGWPTSSYYHIGYHLILATLIQLTDAGIIEAMLASGPLALSVLAISLFFMMRKETNSQAAAFFTTGLAGFGWYMPGHAMNWGKYPALFGLIAIIFVINLISLMTQKNTDRAAAKKIMPILLAALATATIIHTRALIVCGLFAMSLLIANKWEGWERKLRRFTLGAFLVLLVTYGVFLRTDGTFLALLSPYAENDAVSLALVLFLISFSIWKFPKLTFALLLFIILLFISVYIPVYGLFGYSNLFLLDRPYVQMLLHIPLSLLGGLGFGGLLETMGSQRVGRVVQAAAFGILVFNAVFYQNYYPSDCCQLAGTDDAAAFSWIQQELPQETTLLIASQNLSFTPNVDLFTTTGIDGGIWVSLITGRKTTLLSSNADFSQPEVHEEICDTNVEYIYVGSKAESFKEGSLIAKPEWYQGVFILPQVKIYQVIECP